jgi:hypothetical protein
MAKISAARPFADQKLRLVIYRVKNFWMLTGFAFASERPVEDCSAKDDWDARDYSERGCGASEAKLKIQ